MRAQAHERIAIRSSVKLDIGSGAKLYGPARVPRGNATMPASRYMCLGAKVAFQVGCFLIVIPATNRAFPSGGAANSIAGSRRQVRIATAQVKRTALLRKSQSLNSLTSHETHGLMRHRDRRPGRDALAPSRPGIPPYHPLLQVQARGAAGLRPLQAPVARSLYDPFLSSQARFQTRE